MNCCKMYKDSEDISLRHEEVVAACALLLFKNKEIKSCVDQASAYIGNAQMKDVVKAHPCCFDESMIDAHEDALPRQEVQDKYINQIQTSVLLTPKTPNEFKFEDDLNTSKAKISPESNITEGSFCYGYSFNEHVEGSSETDAVSTSSSNTSSVLEDKENIYPAYTKHTTMYGYMASEDINVNFDEVNKIEITREPIELDYVVLGFNGTKILRSTYESINWSTAKKATRSLLRALIPRDVLATHSLSGNRSPAFPYLPKKDQLFPEVVNDIVSNIKEMFGVTERHVRGAITIACADEAKLYRARVIEQQRRVAAKKRRTY